MDIVAHSRPSPSGPSFQSLREHLIATAERASRNAAPFENGSLPYLIGLLHDLGKASADFQRRILDHGARVDHSTFGAIEVTRRLKALGRIAAYCIAGHHTGLPDGSRLKGRLEDFESLPIVTQEAMESLALEISTANSSFFTGSQKDGFCRAFYIRMLYSALVDADYLDTEYFMSPDKSLLRQRSDSFETMIPLVESHIRGLGRSDCPIDDIRRRVLNQSRSLASSHPGFFTLPVPTGGGKTLTSLLFAMEHAKANHQNRIIYVIPFTSIIEQTCDVFRRCVGEENVLEHHSNRDVSRRPFGSDPMDEDVLELASENWDFPIIVTTNVQFFESLYSNRSSRCRKLHNIARSVVVLDEAQMLPTEFLRPCMHALEELTDEYGCSVVLSTATQPVFFETPGLLRRSRNPVSLVESPGLLYDELRRVQGEWMGSLDDVSLADRIRTQDQVLCIVNTRRHASDIYRLLEGSGDTWHLSANMCAEHRSDTIREIRTALREGRPCRVVSTQLVEAGVDLDFPVVYRAIAGIDSLVQSAGRCNREGRAQHGMLHVFDSGDQEKLKGWLARTAALGKEVIGRFSDFLSPEAVREYFSRLYSLEGELDTNQIVKTLQEGRRTLDFPFESISNEFHFIEENSIGVVVPYKPAVIDPIIESICSGDSIRTNLRRIQRHVVQIPFYSADRLKKDGMVVPLTDDLFLLTDARHYQRERCGLVLDSEDAGPLPTLMI